jgi:hypothetical protein
VFEARQTGFNESNLTFEVSQSSSDYCFVFYRVERASAVSYFTANFQHLNTLFQNLVLQWVE